MKSSKRISVNQINSSSLTPLATFNDFTSSYNTGSFTGSFSGSGANLFDIPASGIVGLNLSQIISGSVSASISPDNGLQINTNVTAPSFTGSFSGDGSNLENVPMLKWIEKSTNYSINNLEGVLADTTGGSFNIMLPSSPSIGDTIGIADAKSNFNTSSLFILRNGNLIQGQNEDLEVNLKDASFLLIYTGATNGWKLDTFLQSDPSQYTLNALADVDITTPATGDILQYNSISGEWENTSNLDLKENAANKKTDLNSTDPDDYPNVNAVNAGLNNGIINWLFVDAGNLGSHTGNTANTIVFTIDIPANTYINKDFFKKLFYFSKTGTSGCTARLYLGTTGTTADELIAVSLSGATGGWVISRERSHFFSGNLVKVANSNLQTDLVATDNLLSVIDTTVALKLSVAFQLTDGSNIATLLAYHVGRLRKT
jgi:hypothetical protein